MDEEVSGYGDLHHGSVPALSISFSAGLGAESPGSAGVPTQSDMGVEMVPFP